MVMESWGGSSGMQGKLFGYNVQRSRQGLVDAAMQSTGKGGKGRQGWGRRIINKTNLLGNMVDE